MSNTPIRKHPGTGLLYTLHEGKATIVGSSAMDLSRLEIPRTIIEGETHYPVTAVGESAFAYMHCLQELVIPDTLTHIGPGAFESTGVTEVQLHSGFESLSPYAFFGCLQLTHVSLPLNTIFTLDEQSFGGCTALKREHVDNLQYHSDEDAARAGLPEASAPQTTVVIVEGGAEQHQTVKSPAEQLLEQGLALEDENRPAEAAAAYMQAHELRTAVDRIGDQVRQAAFLRPIAAAEYRLAVLMKFGLAPARNPDGSPRPTAAELLHFAVDTAGLADAMYHLGDMYATGCGVDANAALAIDLLKRAAAQEHERACLDLGYIYLYGTLDEKKPATAQLFFRKCAEINGAYVEIALQELSALYGL